MDESSSYIVKMKQKFWFFIKEKININLSAPRLNMLGLFAYNGNSVISFKDNSKSPAICEFLDEIREANQNEKPIVVLLDNLKSHKTDEVKQKASDNNIILIYNTPYSPELNPIENIWKDSKKDLCTKLIKTKEESITLYTDKFNELTQNNYAGSWIEKFQINVGNIT